MLGLTKQDKLRKFNRDYFSMKIGAYKALTEEKKLLTFPDKKLAGDKLSNVFIAQMGEYILGEDVFSRDHSHLSDKEGIKIVLSVLPKATTAFLKDNPAIVGSYKQILKFKDDNLTELLGREWTESNEAARVKYNLSHL